MERFPKSDRLANVRYEIRGPVMQEAMRMEEAGHQIIKLNIGNPAPFGFKAPDAIVQEIIRNLSASEGYCDSKGLMGARDAIVQYYRSRGFKDVTPNDIYIGNGVSELIMMTMQTLLNDGDEILIPAPDYPLWTAAATLAGGKVCHYLCDEGTDWMPDLDDIRKKITPRTKAIVIINPNNPTGAVYSKELLLELAEIARQNKLMVLADEIYEKIVYDGAQHHHIAALAPDLFCVTYNGLSKAYLAAGFRQGWLMLTGADRAFIHAPVCQHPDAARHSRRTGRQPEHRIPGFPGRQAVRTTRQSMGNAQQHRRRKLRETKRCAVSLPQNRHQKIQHRQRCEICSGFFGGGKSSGGAGHGL